MPLVRNQTISLPVDSLSSDGSGVGRYEGQAVFVPGAAAGDFLRIKIVKAARTHAFGRIEQVVTPGPGRITPDCPVYRTCGGCAFRHITYEAELSAKQGFVQDALQRIGKIAAPVLPILPSPEQDGYRNKVQYPVEKDASAFVYGFYARRSHRIVPHKSCRLQPPLLNRIARRTAELLAETSAPTYDEASGTGLVRHIYLRHGRHTGEVLVCLVCAKPRLRGGTALAETLAAEFPEIQSVVLNVNPAKTNVICGPQNIPLLGSGHIREEICGVPLRLDPLSFCQVNTLGAERLFSVVQQFAALKRDETLLDLYCGAGAIGLSMAQRCREVIGVEIVQDAVRNAEQSAREMGVAEKCRFLCEDAGTTAARLQREGLRPDVAVLDPPRRGCSEETLRATVDMQPARLVMVSCNPATLARDMAYLAQHGYFARRVQPVDLFPRTPHVECVVLLEKEKEPLAE